MCRLVKPEVSPNKSVLHTSLELTLKAMSIRSSIASQSIWSCQVSLLLILPVTSPSQILDLVVHHFVTSQSWSLIWCTVWSPRLLSLLSFSAKRNVPSSLLWIRLIDAMSGRPSSTETLETVWMNSSTILCRSSTIELERLFWLSLSKASMHVFIGRTLISTTLYRLYLLQPSLARVSPIWWHIFASCANKGFLINYLKRMTSSVPCSRLR